MNDDVDCVMDPEVRQEGVESIAAKRAVVMVSGCQQRYHRTVTNLQLLMFTL